jgi:DNA-binding NarL/FixJ family response regulator
VGGVTDDEGRVWAAPSIRVLIVDDDPLVRSGLGMILGGAQDIRVVGEADDGDEVPAAVGAHRPDVVLMDLRMPRVDGLAATEALRAGSDPPEVLVLTTFDADEHVLRALRAGASGFLLKDTPPADIVDAVRAVAAGDSALSPSVARRLVAHVADDEARQQRDDAIERLRRLTDRERDVAEAIGQGWSNARIADDLAMSVATVKAHVTQVLAKLRVDNRVQVALLVQTARRP